LPASFIKGASRRDLRSSSRTLSVLINLQYVEGWASDPADNSAAPTEVIE